MYEWSNGAKYVGEHDLDQRTGFGTMIYPDGAEFSGIWENGVHVKFQNSPDEEVTSTTSTTSRPAPTTASTEVTTRRRKKVIRKKKGRKPRSVNQKEIKPASRAMSSEIHKTQESVLMRNVVSFLCFIPDAMPSF